MQLHIRGVSGFLKVDGQVVIQAPVLDDGFVINVLIYRTRAIITGLYTFYPLFEVQKHFSKEFFFLKILTLCMVSI
jgi:hypothetical protein